MRKGRALRLPARGARGTFAFRMRRALSLLLIATVLGAAGWTLWHWQGAPADTADPWRAVPAEAAVVIELDAAWRTWDRFTHSALVWRRWEQQAGAAGLNRLMLAVQQRLEADPGLLPAVGGGRLIIAVLRSGDGATPLVIGRCAEPARAAQLLGLAAAQDDALREGRTAIAPADSLLPPLHLAWRSGLWLLSPSADAIEEARIQLERGTPLQEDALFTQARATLAADADARVLVRTERLLNLLAERWDPQALERLAIPPGWLALDLRAQADVLRLTGLLAPAAPNALSTGLGAQGEGAWDIARVLPGSVALIEARHVGDAEAALREAEALDARIRRTEAVEPWMSGAVGVARSADPERGWLVAGTADPERAQQELTAPCASAPCDTLHHRGIRLTRMPEARPRELLLGSAARLPQQPWWALLGQHAVLSDDPEAVKASIDAWTDGGSLAEDAAARAQFKRMSGEAGLTWWCSMARGAALLSPTATQGPSTPGLLAALDALSAQASPARSGWLHVSLALHAGEAPLAALSPAGDAPLWTCAVGAAITSGPHIVLNHTNGLREALVQDSLHRIHLISAAGQVLWTRALDGPLLGVPHQVDRFRNGKLQLLLGTRSAIHLIDRNGKDVGVPHPLPAPASAPMAVFDYERKKEYRIVQPLADGTLLNLDLDGAPVQGWSAPKLDPPAKARVEHLRVGGKDYLLVAQADGALKLLDRKGQERERAKARLDGLQELRAAEPGQQLMATRLHWIDADGRSRMTTLGGEERAAEAEGHASPATEGLVIDLNKDGRPEHLLVLPGGQLEARKGTVL